MTFSSAPSGVSVGDRVEMIDEGLYYATFTYLVTVISGSTLFFKFVSETSGMAGSIAPCSLTDSVFTIPPANFYRYYNTISAWESDLGNADIYSSGDDAIGECHNDGAFDESVDIQGLGTLNSVKLTVHPSSRHNGVVGAGARIVRTGSGVGSPIKLGCNELTVEWLEINGISATAIESGVTIGTSALENIVVSNMIIHHIAPDESIDARYGILIQDSSATTVTRFVLNNFIFGIDCAVVAPFTDKNSYGIGQVTQNKGAKLYNNTVSNITTTQGTGYGFYVASDEPLINNIAVGCDTASFKVTDDSSGSALSSHNLSDDNTAGDLGSTANQSTAQTLDDGVSALGTLVSLSNLHLRYITGSTYPLSLAIDRGVPVPQSGTPDEIGTDINGNTRVFGIPDAVAEGYWDIGASEILLTNHPYPATAFAATAYTPPVIPAAAAFELAAVSPTVVVEFPSVTVAVAVAAFVLAGVSPTVVVPTGVTVTPTAAAFELAGVSPTVVIPTGVTITPTAASFELAAVSPTVIVPTGVTVTPAAASFNMAGVNPSAVAGSLSLTPAVAAVEFAGITPTVQLSSVSVTPTASAFELAGVSPSVVTGSVSMTPVVAVVDFAGVAPSVAFGSISITPTASAVELAGINPSITSGSLSVSPAAAVVNFAGISPTTIVGNLSITPTVAALEFAAVSPSVTYSSVSITPDPAVTIYSARLGGIIAGNITVVPNPQALFVYTAADPAVGMSSQTIAVSASAFELAAISPSAINGNLSITPAVSVVELTASLATIHAGVEVTPAVAAFEYVVGSFALIITMDSASLGYSCDGVLDYIGGVLPTDYNIEKNLDYKYDNQS